MFPGAFGQGVGLLARPAAKPPSPTGKRVLSDLHQIKRERDMMHVGSRFPWTIKDEMIFLPAPFSFVGNGCLSFNYDDLQPTSDGLQPNIYNIYIVHRY